MRGYSWCRDHRCMLNRIRRVARDCGRVLRLTKAHLPSELVIVKQLRLAASLTFSLAILNDDYCVVTEVRSSCCNVQWVMTASVVPQRFYLNFTPR